MILGVYYLSTEQKDQIGEGVIFTSTEEVLKAYTLGQVHPHTIIGISTNNYPNKQFAHAGTLITTVGKVILNNVLPSEMPYINDVNATGIISPEEVVGHGENVREAISK
jgi:DNA-directed RNA polymerase subunit beta'